LCGSYISHQVSGVHGGGVRPAFYLRF
jgi:hypothetical protein